MPHSAGTNTPALFWRAFFVFALPVMAALAGGSRAGAATLPVQPPELSQVGKASPEEAARILQQFRQSGVPGQYYLEFELHALPRRGEEQVFQGRLWGGRNAQGAITRVELKDAAGRQHRLLLQNGEKAAVWKFVDGKVAALEVAAWFQPLISGVEVTAFDVQMPFLYWPDATLEKITRMRGRPANAFVFRAPAQFAAGQADVSAARAYLDTQYNALLQTDLISRNNRVVKTFSLLNFKTVDRQPLPKAADYRNELTRDKTRLVVTAAALNLQLPAGFFEPASLARDADTPARGQIVSLD